MPFFTRTFVSSMLGLTLAQMTGIEPARAQVNTEKMRSWQAPGFGGAIDGAVEVLSGNSDVVQLSSSLRLQYAAFEPRSPSPSASKTGTASADLRDLVYVVANAGFGKSEEVFLKTGFAHLRWTRMWWPVLGSELFTQLQFDEFTRLKTRILGGAGFRAVALDHPALRAYVASALMIEHERIDIPEGGSHPREVVTGRWSSYFSMSWSIDRIEAVSTLYVQPRLDRFSDYRILQETEGQVQVIGALKLALTVGLRYDSDPPPGVERLDLRLQHKLRIAF